MTQNIKSLYVQSRIDRRSVNHVLVENDSVVNIIPLSMVQRAQKLVEDLIHTKVTITNFVYKITKSLGMLPIKLIVGTWMVLTTFFMVESSLSYNFLLGRNCIHSNCCVPSLLHQIFMMWHKDNIKIVWVNKKHFQLSTRYIKARYHGTQISPFNSLGETTNEGPGR